MLQQFQMSLYVSKEYLRRMEEDNSYVVEELARARREMPNVTAVIIDERDVYLAQSIIEIGEKICIVNLPVCIASPDVICVMLSQLELASVPRSRCMAASVRPRRRCPPIAEAASWRWWARATWRACSAGCGRAACRRSGCATYRRRADRHRHGPAGVYYYPSDLPILPLLNIPRHHRPHLL